MAKRLGLGLLVLAAVAVLVSCGSGNSGSSSANIVVSVSPSGVTVDTGKTQQFTAVVTGTTNMAVTWEVNGTAGGSSTIGTITTGGLFTAPATVPSSPTVTVTAVSQANSSKTGSVSVTIKKAVIVTISPQPICDPFGSSSPNVQTFGTLQFSANVTGSSNTAVTWQVNSVTGGGPTTGAINTSGLFKAPNSVPTMASGGGSVTACVTITAVSQADSSASASATLQITSKNQEAESPPLIQMGASSGNADDFSPVSGGIECCGGTLGSLVMRGTIKFILSNNHVLARSDQAKLGEPIIQPGLIDAASPCTTTGTTTVGNLSQFFRLESTTTPKIDAAIAQVVTVPPTVDLTGSIEELGATVDASGIPVAAPPATSTVPATAALVGRRVAKSGRSTGITCANVGAINVTVRVTYETGCGTGTMFSENFTDEVEVDGAGFSAEGDSGSLIVTGDTAEPVALLFAGDSSSTVGNPVADVLTAFKNSSGTPTFVGGATHKVIACTLPGPASGSQATVTVPDAAMKRAGDVRDRHAPELLGNPAVVAAGVGGSLDAPGEAAIVLFVQKGVARGPIPAEVEGIRTRVIEGENFSVRGPISPEESSRLISQMPAAAIHLTDSEVARASAIKEKHVGQLMSDPAVQGVGVAASLDSPGEAALMIFVLRGKPHNPIPATIDGLRTRVRETTGFHAGWTSGAPRPHRGCSAPSANSAPATSKKTSRP